MSLTQVVAASVDGNLYATVPPNAKASGAGGNGGSVTRASNTNKLDGVSISRYNTNVFASTVVATDSVSSAGGTLAYNNQKPTAKRLTTKINGSNQSFLLSGASKPSLTQSIHQVKICGMTCVSGYRTTKVTSAIRSGKFNRYTGEFAVGYPQHSDDVFIGVDGYVSGTPTFDNAADPTRSVPGELTYKYGAPLAVSTTYKPKTG